MEKVELTILMPCLNEAETIAVCIAKAKTFLEQHFVQGEIIVADNGSTDGSQEIATNLGARVLNVSIRGYGAALRAGIQSARGQYIIMGDADDSYDFLNLGLMLQRLREGYELVMGNRFKGGINVGAMPFLNRYLGNPVLSFLGRAMFKSNIGDFHCGLRGFQRERFLQLDLKGNGMEFASEMIIRATLKKLKMTEVPIQLFCDGRSRAPHLRPWRDGWRHLRLLLLFSPRWLFFYPGLGLMLGGLVLMLLLSFGSISIGLYTFDIHTLLFASFFMLLGLQTICFGLFSQVIARTTLNIPHHDFYSVFTLERGLMIGLSLILFGSIGSIYSLWYWQHQAFGPLDPRQMMRVIIPALTCLTAGCQIMFSSFFMGLLKIHTAEC